MNEDKKTEWLQEDESDFIILRYTDVLLMYAEAKTMLGNIDQSVFDILDAVRDRAGIAHVAHTTDRTAMMKIIQDERKWEFAFEGLRYFDIRQWFIRFRNSRIKIKSVVENLFFRGRISSGRRTLARHQRIII